MYWGVKNSNHDIIFKCRKCHLKCVHAQYDAYLTDSPWYKMLQTTAATYFGFSPGLDYKKRSQRWNANRTRITVVWDMEALAIIVMVRKDVTYLFLTPEFILIQMKMDLLMINLSPFASLWAHRGHRHLQQNHQHRTTRHQFPHWSPPPHPP